MPKKADEVEVLDDLEEIETFSDEEQVLVEESIFKSKKEEKDDVQKEVSKKKFIRPSYILLLIILISLFTVFCYKNKIFKAKEKNKSELDFSYKLIDNSLNDFDLAFLKMEKIEKNKIYSPMAIKYALKMLSNITKDTTKEEIDNIISKYNMQEKTNTANISLNNSLFIQNGMQSLINENAIDILKNNYKTDIVYTTFNDKNPTNKSSFPIINELWKDYENKKGNFYLLNSLSLNINWKNQLQCSNLLNENIPCMKYFVSYQHENYYDYANIIKGEDDYKSITFNNEKDIKAVQVGASFNNYDIVTELGRENIIETVKEKYEKFLAEGGCGNDLDTDTYLIQYIKELDSNYKQADISTDYTFYLDENIKVFAKDLQEVDGINLQYIGFMPTNESLQDFVKHISAQELNNLIESLQELTLENFEDGVITRVNGTIPVFHFESEIYLKDDLNKLGIKEVFDDNKASLDLVKEKSDYITNILQKASIEFSNEGIRPSASTTTKENVSPTCHFEYLYDVPIETIDLTFDNPYLFLIRDKSNGEVWFIGTVYEPLKK